MKTKHHPASWTTTFAVTAALAAGALRAAAFPAVAGGSFSDDFTSYPKGACLADGSALGAWTFAYAGFGCTQFGADGTGAYLEEKPKPSASAGETHASMALGPSFSGPITFSVDLKTVAQLRTGSAPNAWEVAWMVWDYTDDTHFYYLTVKSNGWELGKEDPAYKGAQRFLASGPSPAIPVGGGYTAKIVQAGPNTVTAFINGQAVATFTDTERPYSSGRIGLYNEDSQVRFQRVSVSPAAGAVALTPAPAPAPSPAPVPAPVANGAASAVPTLSPSAAAAGGTAFNLAVDGAHFKPASYVLWNGVRHPGTVQGSTRIVAYVSPADIAAAGTAQVAVMTPGIGLSKPVTFTINPRS